MIFKEKLSELGIVNVPNFINESDVKKYFVVGIKVHELENVKNQLLKFDKGILELSALKETVYKNSVQRYSVYVYLGLENCLVSLNGKSYSYTPGTLIIVDSSEDLIFYNENVTVLCSFIEKTKQEEISLLNQIVKDKFFIFSNLVQPPNLPDGWDYYSNANADEKTWIFQNLFVNLSNLLKVCTCKIVGVELKTVKNYKFSIEELGIRKPYSFFYIYEGEAKYNDRQLKTGDLLILSNYDKENKKLIHTLKSKHLKLLVCHLEN